MNVRLLKSRDINVLEEYLVPHQAECMFICSNLKVAGIDFNNAYLEGEYFGCLEQHDDHVERLLGVIVHYWNDNIILHANEYEVLDKLIIYLKNNINRPIAGVLGPNSQVEYVIKKLGLSDHSFSINRNEGLYEINLEDLNSLSMPSSMSVISANNISKDILLNWMKDYNIEALSALDNDDLDTKIKEDLELRLKKNDTWVLLLNETPVSLSAFNARLADMVQVGPVWTPPEYRNQGFTRMLLTYTLHHEKLKGIKQAILFTDNPAAIKVYLTIGFKKIGNYCLALLEKPIKL